jgi:hypothetical protein
VNSYLTTALKDPQGKPKDRVIAADTDSVLGSSMICVNNRLISIADFYDNQPDEFIKRDDFNKNFIKAITTSSFLTPSLNLDKATIENKHIKYVMKHTVSKELFEITDKFGNSVVITEDHSIIVQHKRNGKFSSIKPNKLNNRLHNIINIVDADTDSNAR